MPLVDKGGRSRWNYCVITEQPKECHKLFLNFLICEKKKPTLFNSLLLRYLLVREKCISVSHSWIVLNVLLLRSK